MYFYYVYVFLLLHMFCIFCFNRTNWYSSATLTEVFPCLSSVLSQIPGYNSERWGAARILPNLAIIFTRFIVNFSLTTLGSNPGKLSNQSCCVVLCTVCV
jgi:hypothetical protein